ncbi:hypothetical protein BH20ACT14_BH20ACT14_17810 [soil metagenome]
MLAQVAQCDVAVEKAARCLREHDLPSVRCRGDPRRPVDVKPDVALFRDEGLAGVDSHAHLHRPVCKRRPCAFCRHDRVRRTREGDEERIALRVDLDPARLLESLAENPPMLAEQLGVAGAVLAKKPRRTCDIGEEECDRAGRKSWTHLRSRRSRRHPPLP